MKKIHRILIGLLSSMLFAVGLVRAADTLDPLNKNSLGGSALGPVAATGNSASGGETAGTVRSDFSTPPCVAVCDYYNSNR